MRILTALIGFCFLFSSCKKDKLKNEKEILIGKWNWVYTNQITGWCENDEFFEVLTPASEENEYALEFDKKGYLTTIMNGASTGTYRVVFKHFLAAPDPFDFQAIIYLDNDKDNIFGLQVSPDTLSAGTFPFYVTEGCGYAANRFVRD